MKLVNDEKKYKLSDIVNIYKIIKNYYSKIK